MRKFVLLTIAISLIAVVAIFGRQNNRVVEAQSATSSAQVSAAESPSVADGLVQRLENSWPWYVARASGMLAAVSLIILMLSGIGMITGRTFGFLEPITAWASHRALGIVFGLAVLLHIGSLMFDKFVPFGLTQLLVPFSSDFRPVSLFGFSLGSLYVALGVLALYLTVAIIITSLVWINKKPKIWKVTHILSYLVIIFTFVHALAIGSDLSVAWMRWLWIGLGLLILYASLMRFRRAFTV
ncbi:ferric reductase-like transmembrane domain-containing protein [Candidatus Saccharibacteria bacterium]|nr:ferric reductase-like transmembrane domain-containing protein [Candidatus Saccharibacteria bacterium]MCB9821661.1 ferric reductase-like transmembrane domain-containing protein [Candidatus Nomurabacteria bacterium]